MKILPKESNSLINITLAIIYILFGIVKIAIGVAVMSLTPEQVGKIPIAKMFAKEAADKTLAGSMYEYVFVAFGVFTIFHGLVLFRLLPMWFTKIFVTKIVQYGILIVLGLILTIFYGLVLYTDTKISKNKEDYKNYLTMGLIGGILYLLSPPLWECIEYFWPYFKNMPMEQQNMWIITVIIVGSVIAERTYSYYKKQPDTNGVKKVVASQVPIPISMR